MDTILRIVENIGLALTMLGMLAVAALLATLLIHIIKADEECEDIPPAALAIICSTIYVILFPLFLYLLRATIPSIPAFTFRKGALTGLVTIILVWTIIGIQKLAEEGRSNLSAPPAQNPATSTGQANVVAEQPHVVYHGTNKQAAKEIFTTGLWLVGPTGQIWMTTMLEIAKSYASTTGAIVVLHAGPTVKLTDQGNGIYTCTVPNPKPGQEYYKVKGFKSIMVMDFVGNKIM